MVYRKTAQALFLGATLITTLTTTGIALAEDIGEPGVEASDDIAIQASGENLIETLLGRTVHLSGDVSLAPPMRKIPMKTYRVDGQFAEYYPYILHATVEGVELPSLVFYSKTPRDEGFIEVTGIINEQNARTGTKGSGMLYLKETDD